QGVPELGGLGGGEERPGGATVGGLEDARPAHGVEVEVPLAGADVHHLRVRRVVGYGGDGEVGPEVVDGGPGGGGVGDVVGVPQPAGDAAGPHLLPRRVVRVEHQRARAPGDVGGPP